MARVGQLPHCETGPLIFPFVVATSRVYRYTGHMKTAVKEATALARQKFASYTDTHRRVQTHIST